MKDFDLSNNEVGEILEFNYLKYNNPKFIETDPIQIPHLFTDKEDIEISGFITAILAWGQRQTIIKNCSDLMNRMDNCPADFIKNHNKVERQQFGNFVHRTFNGVDCIYFVEALQKLYLDHNGLEGSFNTHFKKTSNLANTIHEWRNTFLSFESPSRTGKHIADPTRNSTAKRILMYLRWMIRKDRKGVDFGIWTKIPPSALYAPIDLHSARVARKLGLLNRTQDDWKAVIELTDNLRKFDPKDPVKYDFALFGLGVNKEL
jgi:uncharacterized protein (TIGR02757 family)